jgi:hypothetical protein
MSARFCAEHPLWRAKETIMAENKLPNGQWLPIGMSIGVSLGVAFGLMLENLALGIGIGFAIGTALGLALQARQAGRGS